MCILNAFEWSKTVSKRKQESNLRLLVIQTVTRKRRYFCVVVLDEFNEHVGWRGLMSKYWKHLKLTYLTSNNIQHPPSTKIVRPDFYTRYSRYHNKKISHDIDKDKE